MSLLFFAFLRALFSRIQNAFNFENTEKTEIIEVDDNDPEPELESQSQPESQAKLEIAEIIPHGFLDDDSVISEKLEPKSLYESFLQIDSDSDHEIIDTDQYGLNLTFNFNKHRNNGNYTAGSFLNGSNTSNVLPNGISNGYNGTYSNAYNGSLYPIGGVGGDSRSRGGSAVPTLEDLFLDILKPLDEYDVAISKFYTPFRSVPEPKYSVTEALLSSVKSNLPLGLFRSERDSIQELVTKERIAIKSVVSPLKPDQLRVVEQYWRTPKANAPVVSAFSIDITCSDLQTLTDQSWLNDNVIDFYLSLVTDHNQGVFCWTTHFYTTLQQKGYKGVARWAKRKKINVLETKRVVVPINSMNTHWAVAVIDNDQNTISYYDSLRARNLSAVENLQIYVNLEAERLGLAAKSYTLQPIVKTPQQQNGYDCGVFTCTVAKYVAQGTPLNFSQKDMPVIRRRMAYEIVQKSLLPENDKAHL